MTQPADPAGRPDADVPPYGQEAPYGPPPGGAATPGDPGAGTPAGADAPTPDAGPGADAWGAPGSTYAAPGGPYAGAPSGGAPSGGTPYAGTPYAGTPYAGPGYWPRNDLGVWSLVLGIAGIVLACGFFTGIPAVLVGANARKAIARGEANNEGIVTAGIVLGWVSTGFGVLMAVLLVLSFLIPLVFLGVTLPWAAGMSSSGY